MRWAPFFAFASAIILIANCSPSAPHTFHHTITYHDRNGDGLVDLQQLRHKTLADADSDLLDNDYDGRYETKIVYGVGVSEETVDLPVPSGVRISKN